MGGIALLFDWEMPKDAGELRAETQLSQQLFPGSELSDAEMEAEQKLTD